MQELLRALHKPILWAACMSIGVNLLMLISPIYMMQLFDRVLTSGHHATLYSLMGLALVGVITLGVLDALRQNLMARAASWLEQMGSQQVVAHTIQGNPTSVDGLQHLGRIRNFLSSPGLFALLDTPWVFFFALILAWMHPWLGLAAIIGAGMLLTIALLTELLSRQSIARTQNLQSENAQILTAAMQSGDAVKAMAMTQPIQDQWISRMTEASHWQRVTAERGALLGGATKAVRMSIQIIVLSLGAVLVLRNELSAGGMIAASIMLGRCLAPMEQAIGGWRNFISARRAWQQLAKLPSNQASLNSMALPKPSGAIQLDALTLNREAGQAPILEDLTLTLEAGSVLAIVGPSGSGKSSLCRLLVGATKPSTGQVSFDNRPVTGWNSDQLGAWIGYLPQGVELLPGTLKENIARFNPKLDEAKVVFAAQLAGVDGLIRQLPQGYETPITPGHPLPLSMGQRQRIGLARALYDNPKFLILDEPNANLDAEGEAALVKAIETAKGMGQTVVVVTHRPALMAVVDKVAILHQGRLLRYGDRNAIRRPVAVPTQSAPNTPSSHAVTQAVGATHV
ncbi:type I secretion system permease/ATPase [Magnetococcus sp. PR-3]|uniref:type I secretion system permease/ATPase n=1 Tax=Magnetococcus sp. PR-3 TaxID=3120355 RepID=UPI002FCE17DD